MRQPVRVITLALRQVEYSVLLPFVFVATWLEMARPHRREAIARATLAMAMMVAGLSAVVIIRQLYI